MAELSDRRIDQGVMISQIEDVLRHSKREDPPAYTLILGAGASFGSVPTAKQILGIPDKGETHPQCIPAWLYNLDHGQSLTKTELEPYVKKFWTNFCNANPDLALLNKEGKPIIVLENGLPDSNSAAEGYKALFDQKRTGGINTPASARAYLRDITLPANGRIPLNGTHFFLASLLSLQRRGNETGYGKKPLYVGKRSFARTLFTTNFDPLLQISLQLFQTLYYMTDRPDLISADALHTDDHPALHLFYAHGSVHRPFLANTDNEITHLRDRNARDLAAYLGSHGVIVLGYSGWDDCLLNALNQTSSFANNLYWLARGESSLTPSVRKFLCGHPNTFWVNIKDGGEFMATLHSRLCPGMHLTEMLHNPIKPLREQLRRVDLGSITVEELSPSKTTELKEESSTPAKESSSATELLQQVIQLLKEAEGRFENSNVASDSAEKLLRVQHQADLAVSSKDWRTAINLFTQIYESAEASADLKAIALTKRGYCFARLNRFDKGIADCTLASEVPHAPVLRVARALYNRGVYFGKINKTEEAIADYTRVIELPNVPMEQMVKSLLNRGVAFQRLKQTDQAIDDYTRVIVTPNAPTETLAKAFGNRGYRYAELQKFEEAKADYTSIIDMPNAPAEQLAKAFINRGNLYAKLNHPEQAIADYSRVISMANAPLEFAVGAFLNRGIAYQNQQKHAEAITDFTQVVDSKNAPSEQLVSALINRSISFAALQNLNDAIKDCNRVIDMPNVQSSQKAKALINRVNYYVEQQKTDEAIADLTRAINLPDIEKEDKITALMNRAIYFAQLEKDDAAIEDCTLIIETLTPSTAQLAKALLNRGISFGRLQKTEEATADLERVIALPNALEDLVNDAREALKNLRPG